MALTSTTTSTTETTTKLVRGFTKPTTVSTTTEAPVPSRLIVEKPGLNPDEIFVPSDDFSIDIRSSFVEEERHREGLKGNAPIQTCLEMAQEGLMPLLPGLKNTLSLLSLRIQV